MSELTERVAREHHFLEWVGTDPQCVCGEILRGRPGPGAQRIPAHVAEVTEAAVRETVKFDPNDGDANAAILTPMLVELARTLEPIKDYAKGYRTALVREGWNETAAEAMAVQVHNSLIESAFRAPA